ncbi:hypothetical protein DU43_15560 [Methanosarcina mazei]|uniref:Glycosyltransferase RgtA/B/C/D-like domain-containing protein n=1 Tax=Methanosarcina mazei TaxID=2209 RepID=A0A0F8KEW9_METMZ|nr:hypothetical protein [Methanosarcina mazei]KKG79370.1 hypothetical protein DU43_15560 [Methanosarcina mazei]
MSTLNIHFKYKLAAILSVLFSTLAIFIAFQNPAKGYELSIYDSTPFIVWFSLILSIIMALFIVLSQIAMNKYILSNFWMIGIFILLFNRLILLYIPYIRGYFSWRGDNISHMGYLIDIVTYGQIPSNNFYPITHILLTVVNIVTGISQIIVVNYSTGIFSIFYVISIYLLATAVLHTKKEQILAVTSVVAVFFSYNVYLMPNGWSQLYLPLLGVLYFKSLEKHNYFEYNLLFVILMIMYPFFHPLSSLYVMFMLTLIGVSIFLIHFFIDEKNDMKLINRTKKHVFIGQLFSYFITYLKTAINKSVSIENNRRSFPLTALLLETSILFTWILSFQKFQIDLSIFYNSILTGTSLDVIGEMQNTLNKINLSGIEFAQLFIKTQGANLIFLGLFAVSLFILCKKRHELQNSKNLLILSGITIFTGFIYAGYLFGIPGLNAIAAKRMDSFLMLFTPIYAGFVLAYFFRKELILKKINLFPILCAFIIFTASVLSINSLYTSPNVFRPTPSVTQMDMKGTDWFLDYHNKEILTTDIQSPIYRFVDGITGTVEQEKILGSRYRHTIVPDHFNYTEMSKLGESYLEDRYMMITKFDTVIYSTVWSAVGRFDPQDFDLLLEDTSVEKLYSNGETEIFSVHAI